MTNLLTTTIINLLIIIKTSTANSFKLG